MADEHPADNAAIAARMVGQGRTKEIRTAPNDSLQRKKRELHAIEAELSRLMTDELDRLRIEQGSAESDESIDRPRQWKDLHGNLGITKHKAVESLVEQSKLVLCEPEHRANVARAAKLIDDLPLRRDFQPRRVLDTRPRSDSPFAWEEIGDQWVETNASYVSRHIAAGILSQPEIDFQLLGNIAAAVLKKDPFVTFDELVEIAERSEGMELSLARLNETQLDKWFELAATPVEGVIDPDLPDPARLPKAYAHWSHFEFDPKTRRVSFPKRPEDYEFESVETVEVDGEEKLINVRKRIADLTKDRRGIESVEGCAGRYSTTKGELPPIRRNWRDSLETIKEYWRRDLPMTRHDRTRVDLENVVGVRDDRYVVVDIEGVRNTDILVQPSPTGVLTIDPTDGPDTDDLLYELSDLMSDGSSDKLLTIRPKPGTSDSREAEAADDRPRARVIVRVPNLGVAYVANNDSVSVDNVEFVDADVPPGATFRCRSSHARVVMHEGSTGLIETSGITHVEYISSVDKSIDVPSDDPRVLVLTKAKPHDVLVGGDSDNVQVVSARLPESSEAIDRSLARLLSNDRAMQLGRDLPKVISEAATRTEDRPQNQSPLDNATPMPEHYTASARMHWLDRIDVPLEHRRSRAYNWFCHPGDYQEARRLQLRMEQRARQPTANEERDKTTTAPHGRVVRRPASRSRLSLASTSRAERSVSDELAPSMLASRDTSIDITRSSAGSATHDIDLEFVDMDERLPRLGTGNAKEALPMTDSHHEI